jgi:hypothetical protein
VPCRLGRVAEDDGCLRAAAINFRPRSIARPSTGSILPERLKHETVLPLMSAMVMATSSAIAQSEDPAARAQATESKMSHSGVNIPRRFTTVSIWANQLLERKPERLVTVAVANRRPGSPRP